MISPKRAGHELRHLADELAEDVDDEVLAVLGETLGDEAELPPAELPPAELPPAELPPEDDKPPEPPASPQVNILLELEAEAEELSKEEPEEDGDGCIRWTVVLTKEDPTQRYGFSHTSSKAEFQKSRGPASVLQDEGPSMLRVNKVADGALVDVWNRTAPAEREIKPGDRIEEVNGVSDIKGMQYALRADKVSLNMVRYSEYFHVELRKAEGDTSKEFGFQFQAQAKLNELDITNVASTGLLEEANQRQIAAGLYQFVVTPGMHIEAVNKKQGDVAAMVQEISDADGVLRMRIRRGEVAAVAREKLQAKVHTLKALGFGAGGGGFASALKAAASRTQRIESPKQPKPADGPPPTEAGELMMAATAPASVMKAAAMAAKAKEVVSPAAAASSSTVKAASSASSPSASAKGSRLLMAGLKSGEVGKLVDEQEAAEGAAEAVPAESAVAPPTPAAAPAPPTPTALPPAPVAAEEAPAEEAPAEKAPAEEALAEEAPAESAPAPPPESLPSSPVAAPSLTEAPAPVMQQSTSEEEAPTPVIQQSTLEEEAKLELQKELERAAEAERAEAAAREEEESRIKAAIEEEQRRAEREAEEERRREAERVALATLSGPASSSNRERQPMGATSSFPEEQDDCLVFEVVLQKMDPSQRYGFAHANGRAEWIKVRGQRYRGTEPPPETLIVREVAPGCLLDEWNMQHPDREVLVCDRIVAVNGHRSIQDMQAQLRTPEITMKIVRYHEWFHVELDRRDNPKRLGIKFEKPNNVSLPELHIFEVAPEGLLEEVNLRMVAQGKYHKVVHSGMRIEAVNQVEGDPVQMAQELINSTTYARVRIRRAEVAGLAKSKVKNRIQMMSAMRMASSIKMGAQAASGAARQGAGLGGTLPY